MMEGRRKTGIFAAGVISCLMTASVVTADLRVDPPRKVVKPTTTYELEVKLGRSNAVILPANAFKTSSVLSNPQSIIAAVSLSLAAVSLVFVLRGKRGNMIVAVLILAIAGIGVTQMAGADLGPPRPVKKSARVTVTKGSGNGVTIVLDEATLRQLLQKARQPDRPGRGGSTPRG